VKMEENPDDPYDTLGVQRGATPERIKEAYDDKVTFESHCDHQSPSVCY
jgi:DnaJ-class molecular chaperone